MTLQVAVALPQVAVILAVPTDTAVTVPSEDTVATASLSDFHVTVLSVVLSGSTVTVSFSLCPTSSDILVALMLRIVASTGFTVIVLLTLSASL